MKLKEVLDSTGAVLLRGDSERLVYGVSTDTRTMGDRALFLALDGPNFDGNRFATRASERGAAALMLRRASDLDLATLPADVPVAVHEAPRRALSDLASWHRSRLDVPVVGITGSSGKTTTKNILAELLSEHHRVVASPSSYNNDVGVPHTLLLADPETEVLVVEMGTNAPGEIAGLSRVARPNAGIITNIGASHLEGLGTVDGVAREKAALFESLPPDGFCVLNADSQYADLLRDRARCRALTFSVEGPADFQAERPLFHSGGTTFTLHGREITSPLLGLHNVSNLLAALACCCGLGFELDELLPAVSRLTGGHRRMERRELGDVTLFDDTYNANPESARAAVRVLAGLHGARRRVLVMGDMLELGANAPELHHAIGREAAESGIELLVLVGEVTQAAAAGALEAGMEPGCVRHLGSVEAARAELLDLLGAGDVVLIKGSRAMGLEALVDGLVERFGTDAQGEAQG